MMSETATAATIDRRHHGQVLDVREATGLPVDQAGRAGAQAPSRRPRTP
ncbi:hypothetical protein [Arthrobacter sp. SX1312]|nr:hypothetical protein [Arthrobacter sp. SX1312]